MLSLLMNSTDYVKSKTRNGTSASVITVQEAIKAIELAKLEGKIEAFDLAGHYSREIKIAVLCSEAGAKKRELLKTI